VAETPDWASAPWAEKRAVMLAYLRDNLAELPTTLNSRARIGTGRKL